MVDINLNVNITISPSKEAPAWVAPISLQLGQVLQQLGLVITKEDNIMSALTDALDQAEAAAAANSKADDAVEQLLVTLSQKITDLANSQTDPATVERINALASAISDRAGRLAAATVANTPAA